MTIRLLNRPLIWWVAWVKSQNSSGNNIVIGCWSRAQLVIKLSTSWVEFSQKLRRAALCRSYCKQIVTEVGSQVQRGWYASSSTFFADFPPDCAYRLTDSCESNVKATWCNCSFVYIPKCYPVFEEDIKGIWYKLNFLKGLNKNRNKILL